MKKKEIVINGSTYVLKEKVTGKCDDLNFKTGDWIRKTWKDGSGDVDIFLTGRSIEGLDFETNHYIRTKGDKFSSDLSSDQDHRIINLNDNRYSFSKLNTEEVEEHLISEAKRRYLKGTKYKVLDTHPAFVSEYIGSVAVVDQIPNLMRIGSMQEIAVEVGKGFAYYRGKWAEIIKEEPIKIGGYDVKKSNDGIKIGCEHFDNSELRTLNRLFNICGSENLTLRITRDDLMVNVRDGENLSTTSYEDLFKGTEIGNIKF